MRFYRISTTVVTAVGPVTNFSLHDKRQRGRASATATRRQFLGPEANRRQRQRDNAASCYI